MLPRQQNRSLHCASLRSAPVGMARVFTWGLAGAPRQRLLPRRRPTIQVAHEQSERHAGPDVPALSSPNACACTMSTGAIPTRRRCCWCMAGATIAATGTGWRRRCASDWHIICPDLRGHGDSQWSPDGNYSMAAYIYDLAQLDPPAGAWRRSRSSPIRWAATSACATPASIPDKVRKLVAIEGLGPSPKVIAERGSKPHGRAHARLDRRAAQALRPPAAPLSDHRGRLQAHAGGEQAPLGRAGAAPDAAGRQPERGRHLQLEVRQLRPRLARPTT